jgi:hypothetical protein
MVRDFPPRVQIERRVRKGWICTSCETIPCFRNVHTPVDIMLDVNLQHKEAANSHS